jgi:membrane-bound metal-dependent hydrolase YbcI (DUF457 family)
MALAYLLAKGSGKLLKINFNIPLVLVLSIIPDIDIVIGYLLNTEIHRGPTHSIVVAVLVFIPFFLYYRQRATPYFVALASHSVIGDFFIGGQLQLFWPLSTSEFGLTYISIYSTVNVVLEFTLFVIATVVMFKAGDIYRFFRNSKLNLVLAIPIFTVLLPTVASYPLHVPLLLVSISVLLVLKRLFK